MRQPVTDARRIVVKVGSSSLTTAAGGLDRSRVDALVEALIKGATGVTAATGGAGTTAATDGAGVIAATGGAGTTASAGPPRAAAVAGASRREVVLVSSGAIAAGLAPLGLPRRPRDLATQQAAASVGQGLLMRAYTEAFAGHGRTVGQVLLTVDDVTRRAQYRNAYRTLRRLLDLGAIPIVNENDTVATDEIRFGDNDRLAALVAALIHADALVLLSDVDALYTGDPARPESRRVEVVADPSDLDGITIGRTGAAGVGTGGMVTKIEAARIATGAGIPVVLTSAAQAGPALAGDDVGTFFRAAAQRPRSRLFWLAHATEPRGRLHLDDGAVRAVVGRRASLLPAGITKVDGRFIAGEPVDLVDTAGRPVARGLVNYDAVELPELLGRSTGELAATLGPNYDREVVHRDDLVLL